VSHAKDDGISYVDALQAQWERERGLHIYIRTSEGEQTNKHDDKNRNTW